MPAECAETIVMLVDLLRGDLLNPDGTPFAEDQVRVYNQKVPIPEDDRAYVVVAFRRARPYGLNKTYVSKPAIPPENLGTLTEVMDSTTQETYTISIFSSSKFARQLKEQILFALNCERAERFQEIHGFKIANLPDDFVDASAAEASAILNRYDISFNVLTRYHRERDVIYYDQFTKPGIAINQ